MDGRRERPGDESPQNYPDAAAPDSPKTSNPLAWGQRDPEVENRFRRTVTPEVARIIALHKHETDTAILLAIGEKCPCSLRWQREIWIEVVMRLMAERPRVAGAGA